MVELQESLNLEKKELSNKTFKEIAERIISNCCIKNGSDAYYIPIEIEFYFHSKRMPYNKDGYEKDHITYPRKINEAGKLLYHYSGIDICFKNSEFEGSPEFGGILIRSLLKVYANGNTEMIYGPLCCKDVLLNEAKQLPSLEYISDNSRPMRIGLNLAVPTKRYGITENTNLCLRYYAKEYGTKDNNDVIKRWSYKKGDIVQVDSQKYDIKDNVK